MATVATWTGSSGAPARTAPTRCRRSGARSARPRRRTCRHKCLVSPAIATVYRAWASPLEQLVGGGVDVLAHALEVAERQRQLHLGHELEQRLAGLHQRGGVDGALEGLARGVSRVLDLGRLDQPLEVLHQLLHIVVQALPVLLRHARQCRNERKKNFIVCRLANFTSGVQHTKYYVGWVLSRMVRFAADGRFESAKHRKRRCRCMQTAIELSRCPSMPIIAHSGSVRFLSGAWSFDSKNGSLSRFFAK
ncbi:hypothetical protein ON010_g14635 [Phytophthora cinnamomi]|nr:hypothetical protein ON010_g14635 [Phytophthora cinnamomi]